MFQVKENDLYLKALSLLMVAYYEAISPGMPINEALVNANIRLYLKRARFELWKEVAQNG